MHIFFSLAFGITICIWCVSASCPNTGNRTDEKGVIVSSQNGRNYENNERCTWYIDAGYISIIRLHFTSFYLETCCGCDYLLVYDDSDRLVKKFCGKSLPPDVYIRTGRHMKLYFHTDSSNRYSGFRINYEVLRAPSPCPNVGDLTDKYGVITSQKEATYPNNQLCAWKIHVGYGRSVRLRFSKFSLQRCTDCNCDYLAVYDSSDRLVRKLCSEGDIPSDITVNATHGRSIRLSFVTDLSVASYGFTLNYQVFNAPPSPSRCPGPHNLTDEYGVIDSHFGFGYSNYTNNQQCEWYIPARRDRAIRLHIVNFSLEQCLDCTCDSLSLHEGSEGSVRKLCGSRIPSYITLSNNTSVRLVFATDSVGVRQGFRIIYQVITHPPRCPGPLDRTSEYGVIISHYGVGSSNYSSYQRCEWNIHARYGSGIRLYFTKFSLEQTLDCVWDYLAVYDGSGRMIRKLCGSQIPTAFTLGRNVRLLFVTDGRNESEGFRIIYRIFK